jgi:hypothetical protein
VWENVLSSLLDQFASSPLSFVNQVSPNRGESVAVCPKTTPTVILKTSNAGYSGKPKKLCHIGFQLGWTLFLAFHSMFETLNKTLRLTVGCRVEWDRGNMLDTISLQK